MLWLLFLALTTISWGAYDLFFKGAGDKINYFLALLIIGLVQVIIAVPFVVYYYFNKGLTCSLKECGLAALMGILLGLGTIFFFYTFKFGASASIAIPVYSIGVALIGAIGGILFFKEIIDLKIFIGLIFGIISILLLTIK